MQKLKHLARYGVYIENNNKWTLISSSELTVFTLVLRSLYTSHLLPNLKDKAKKCPASLSRKATTPRRWNVCPQNVTVLVIALSRYLIVLYTPYCWASVWTLSSNQSFLWWGGIKFEPVWFLYRNIEAPKKVQFFTTRTIKCNRDMR